MAIEEIWGEDPKQTGTNVMLKEKPHKNENPENEFDDLPEDPEFEEDLVAQRAQMVKAIETDPNVIPTLDENPKQIQEELNNRIKEVCGAITASEFMMLKAIYGKNTCLIHRVTALFLEDPEVMHEIFEKMSDDEIDHGISIEELEERFTQNLFQDEYDFK